MGLSTIDPHGQKEHTEIYICSNLVLIGLILTEIQPFKNVKILKEMFGHPDAGLYFLCVISVIGSFSYLHLL